MLLKGRKSSLFYPVHLANTVSFGANKSFWRSCLHWDPSIMVVFRKMAFFVTHSSRHIIQTKLVLHSSFQSISISCVFYNLREILIESDPPTNLITNVPIGTCEVQSCWGDKQVRKLPVSLSGTCFTVCHRGRQRRRWHNCNKVVLLG